MGHVMAWMAGAVMEAASSSGGLLNSSSRDIARPSTKASVSSSR